MSTCSTIKKKPQNKKVGNIPFDGRNYGGKKYLIDHHFNHKQSIINMKSTLNTLQTPFQLQKKNSIPIFKKIQEYHEVFETFRRVASVKKGSSNSLVPPKTYFLKYNKKTREKNKFFKDYEHFLHLLAQYNNIQSMGSMKERKKRKYDWIAYPAKFFRRGTSANQQRSQYSNMYNSFQAKTAQQELEKIEQEKWQQIFDMLPSIDLLEDEEVLNVVKEELVNAIIEHRLFKEEEFIFLKNIFLQKNPHLNEEDIVNIIQEIYDVFNE